MSSFGRVIARSGAARGHASRERARRTPIKRACGHGGRVSIRDPENITHRAVARAGLLIRNVL
jgi:hypothetical protein